MGDPDPYRLWSYEDGKFKIGFLRDYQTPLFSEGRQITEAYVERQRRIEAAVVTAVKAQFYQTAEEARPLEIQEARQQAWFLIYHTSGLNWSWFEATTFFEEMFGHENTVIKAREQYIWRRNYFLGEVPWDIRNLRALYAAISAYEVETGLAIAEIVRRRQYKGWPRVVREQMLGFGAVERIPMRTVRVKYLQAFPRRPAVQQQQQQRVPELLNPHWND